MERYNPHPFHIILIMPILVGGAAILPLGWNWLLLGLLLLLIGVGAGLWIVVASINRSATEYNDSRADLEFNRTQWLKELARTNSPEIWLKFGLAPPVLKQPSQLALSDTSTANIVYPIGGATLQLFADGVLQNKGLTTAEWMHVMPADKVKAMRKIMKDNKLIKEKIKDTPTLGYVLTHAGRIEMLKHASPTIQMMFAQQDRDRSTQTLLSDGV